MNGAIPYWAVVIFAVIAGAGAMAVADRFRNRPADPIAAAAQAIEAAAAAYRQIRPRATAHHQFDTMDVLADGYQAGRHATPAPELHHDTPAPELHRDSPHYNPHIDPYPDPFSAHTAGAAAAAAWDAPYPPLPEPADGEPWMTHLPRPRA